MVQHPTGGVRSLGSGLVVTLILLLSIGGLLHAQEGSGIPLSSQINPQSLRTGLRFTLEVPLPDQNLPVQDAPVVGPLVLPPGISLIFGPEVTGGTSPGITWYLRADRPGWWDIPGVQITWGGREYSLSGQRIGIAQDREGFIPPVLEWIVPTQTLVEGQSIGVVLMLGKMPEYRLPEGLQFSQPQGALFEEVSGLGTAVSNTLGGITLHRFPMAGFILTPSRSGGITIPGAQVLVDGNRVAAPGVTLTAESLPEDGVAGGAVGSFSLTSELSPPSLNPGDTAVLRLRLDGTGNLNFLQLPEPQIEGSQAISSNETFRLTPHEAGYRGYREITYQIQAGQSGRLQVRIPSMGWYNPQSARIEGLPARVLTADITPVVVSPESTDQQGLRLLPPERVMEYNLLFLYRRAEAYLVFIPFLFVGVGIRFRTRRRKPRVRPKPGKVLAGMAVFIALLSGAAMAPGIALEHQAGLEESHQAFLEGDYTASLEFYQFLESQYPENPGVLHNVGVIQAALGSRDLGVYYLGQALRRSPRDEGLIESLRVLQATSGLDRQHSIPPVPRGDSLFILVLVSGSLLLLFIPLWFARGNPIKTVVTSLLLVVLAGSITGIVLYDRGITEDMAIVRGPQGILKKIPEEGAADWLALPGGTSVRYKTTSGTYVLLETSYGLSGWMQTQQLIGLEK